MKKLLALLTAAALLFSLTACNNGGEGTSSTESAVSETASKYVHDVDIMAYVREGVIPELPIGLGDYMDEAKEIYGYYAQTEPPTESQSGDESAVSDPFASQETQSTAGDDALSFVQHEEFFGMMLEEEYLQVTANVGEAYYLYKTRYEGYGISKIACMKNCYGFIVGAALKSDVMDSINLEPTLIDAVDPATIDFLPGASMMEFTGVSYTEGDHTVTFYFADDFLSFVTIEDDRYWYDDDEA